MKRAKRRCSDYGDVKRTQPGWRALQFRASGAIAALAGNLNDETSESEASELLRDLVSEVRLHPDEDADDGHAIDLYGELAAIMELTTPRNAKHPPC